MIKPQHTLVKGGDGFYCPGPFRDAIEKNLVIKCYAEVQKGTKRNVFSVVPMTRLGATNSRLYLLYPTRNLESIPYVVKVGPISDIRREYKAITDIKPYFDDADPAIPLQRSKAYAAIMHRLRGDIEFQEIAYSDRYVTKDLCDILNNIYKTCQPAHSKGKIGSIVSQRDYAWYLRGPISKKRIAAFLGMQSNHRTVTLTGRTFTNPLVCGKEIPQTIKGVISRVHGDLHPKNMILDGSGHPRLIDFAWAQYPRHMLVDYALLEISLRWLLLPASITTNPDEQLAIDDLMLDETPNIAPLLKSRIQAQHRKHYKRMYEMVTLIRHCARQRLADAYSTHKYCFCEYLWCMFHLLYGLMAIPSYLPAICVPALAQLGVRITNDYQ